MFEQQMLQGQIAVVTGGGRGIGSAVCIRLAELGAHVVVNYSRSEGEAQAVADQIKSAGGKAHAVGFDVSSPDAVDAAFKKLVDDLGRIDILVNNAGIALDGLVVRTKVTDWQRTIDVNLSGAFYCARAVTKTMMKQKAGRIVNISSVIGERGNAGQVSYAASKSGLFGLTKSLARELASRGITVNAITPGYIDTDMTSQLPSEIQQQIQSEIPLQRFGTAGDVADVVAFFCSPASSYVTGQILGVNGGLHM